MVNTDDTAAWYAVRAQPKRERSAAQYIRKELGHEVISPQVKYVKVTRRGKVKWSEAMFPGYLFVRFIRSEHERGVCYAPGVLKLVKFGENVPVLDEGFIQNLKAELGDQEEVNLVRGVEVGDQYEVATGPFKGQQGKVQEVLPGGDRVMLLLNFLGGEQHVDVDIYSLLLSSRPDLD